jgi:acetoin:2,6-dichlorophenolindophenol oxidoreductase subunit alpha
MLTIRLFEEKIVELYPEQKMKTPVHLYIGQEAIAAGVCANLKREDYVFGTHRSHGVFLAKGGDMNRLMAELYGKKTGCSKGKGGSMHVVDTDAGICGTTAIVGGNIPLAAGAALSIQLQNQNNVSVAFFGDGASDEGVLHETLNFAALKKLPVIFLCENNFYATNSHRSKRQSYDHIYKLASGYGIPGVMIDGNDAIEVYQTSKKAIDRARKGAGPSFIECKTYRWKAHVGPDCDFHLGCRPQQELDEWTAKCPINRLEQYLIDEGQLTIAGKNDIIRSIDKEIEDAYQFAMKSSYPDEDDLYNDLFAENLYSPPASLKSQIT